MSRSRYGRPRFGGAELIGIVLIVVGGFYLVGNAGIVNVDWSVLWPILLIVVGLFIVVAAFGGSRRGGITSTAVPRDGVSALDLDLGVGAGAFRVGAGAAQLVEVESDDDDVRSRVDRHGEQARVELRQDVAWFPFSWRGRTRWDVRLAPDVPTRLSVNGGAGDFLVDMGGLMVRSAHLSLGAAQIRVVLPRPTGEIRVVIRSGASSITVEVPPGVEARVSSSGLLSVTGRNETPGFGAATNRVLVDIAAGASSVRIV